MRFVELGNGCQVCISHLPNKDGYLRKTWGNARSGDRHAEMFHRTIYRAHLGEVPEGHEVDHQCRTRGCCNPAHLRSMSRADHLVHTNRTRYRDRQESARLHWESTGDCGTAIAKKFGVTPSAACRWVRQWQAR